MPLASAQSARNEPESCENEAARTPKAQLFGSSRKKAASFHFDYPKDGGGSPEDARAGPPANPGAGAPNHRGQMAGQKTPLSPLTRDSADAGPRARDALQLARSPRGRCALSRSFRG